jgi:hypothetical protein
MAVREFPALGFDPAPGRPADLDALGHDVARHGNSLATARQRVAEIHAPGWAGQAANAFTAEIAALPGDLDRSVGAFGQVAGALDAYALALDDAQRHARLLEQRAVQARAAQQHAADLADILRHGPDGENDAARQARQQDLRGVRLRADDAGGELAAILREAHALEERAFAAAEQAARRIHAAAEQAPYREPNLFQQGLDQFQRGWESTKKWVADHAEVLHTISGVLKGIAGGAAVVALAIQVVPVLGQIASTIPLTVAAITGGAALGIDVLLKLSTGEGTWAMLGLDVALTVIPGAALARAGRALLRPAGSGLAAMARAPFVAKVLRPVRTTVRSAGLALPGVARTVRDRFATLGRRLPTDERGSIGIGQGGDDAVSRPVRDGLRTTEYQDRAAARQALSGAQRQAANRFFKGATGKSVNFRSTELPNGGQRLEFFSPADTPGYGKLYVQEIDADGVTIRRYKDTMGPEGLIERKWIVGGP